MSPHTELLTLSRVALDRYQVIARIEAKVLGGVCLAEAVGQVLHEVAVASSGSRIRLSERTVYRWLAAFKREGLAGLEPAGHPGVAASAVLPAALIGFLEQEKKRDEAASVPEVIRRARAAGVIGEQEPISRVSVWRACRRLGLPLRRAHIKAATDMRRFAYPHRMLCVLADGKHFRAGAHRAKRVAMVVLDDATRFALAVAVGASETAALFVRALESAIHRFGLMAVLYLDHGSGFIAHDTRTVLARLNVRLVLGTVAYPEGHGKIERFNRTFAERLLRCLAGRPEVDPSPEALTLRLSHWLATDYNRSPHEGLDGQTPEQRFAADVHPLSLPASPAWLASRFVLPMIRRVSGDNVISFCGTAFEAPRGHRGERITVSRHLLEHDRLTIIHGGVEVTLRPVDLAANAYARRARRRPAGADEPPGESAADAAFERDLAPIISPDGDYPEGDSHE